MTQKMGTGLKAHLWFYSTWVLVGIAFVAMVISIGVSIKHPGPWEWGVLLGILVLLGASGLTATRATKLYRQAIEELDRP